jgi:putative phosphoesterase
MRIAIVSDTHSRHHTVEKVAKFLAKNDINLVLHCGDIEDVETVRLFGDFSTQYVLGNCDSDTPELRRVIDESGGKLHEPFGNLEIEGCKLAWTHGDNHRLMRDVVESDYFDYVFYGHTHHAEQHRVGRTLVVNPGALHRAKIKTFMVLDVSTRELESIPVE